MPSYGRIRYRLGAPARCGLSGVQFHDVAVGHLVLVPDLLAIETRRAPQSRIAQQPSQIAVHEPRHVADRLAAAHRERPLLVGRMSGHLGVHAHDAEAAEQSWRDPAEVESGRGRDRERGEGRIRQVA